MHRQYQIDDTRKPGEALGFRLDSFPRISKEMDGISPGFYIIAANPHVGKTLLLVSLVRDLLESNPEVKGIYYSLDDSKVSIGYRLLSAKLGIPKTAIRKKESIPPAGYVASHIHQGRKWLDSICTRLDVFDAGDEITPNKIKADIDAHGRGANLFVIIDGLANLSVESRGIREAAEERARVIKEVADKYRVPVITTHEVRKVDQNRPDPKLTMDDIKETGKFAFNADAIWLLNKTDTGEHPCSRVELAIAKNKISDVRKIIHLRMDTTTGTASEEAFTKSPMGRKK